MAQVKSSELKPLIDQVITALMDELTDGFTAEQVEWVLQVMRSTILPYQLRHAADDTDEGKRTRVQLVIRDLKQALAGQPPHQRWRAIQQTYYTARLLPLSEGAFDLALKRLHTGKTTDETRARVAFLRAALSRLTERMEQKAPRAAQALASVISETSVDLAYAAGEVDVMSLRVGHVHSQRTSHMVICPGCGTANPPGSRFCNRCGTALPG